VPAGFRYHGALSTYEKLGFTRDRQIGKHRWVVTKIVEPRSQQAPLADLSRPLPAVTYFRASTPEVILARLEDAYGNEIDDTRGQ
jgi:hypothetical protein